MKRTSLVVVVALLALPGCCCPGGCFSGACPAPFGSTAATPVESVDSFAKKQGVSRQEAAGYLREGQTMAAEQAGGVGRSWSGSQTVAARTRPSTSSSVEPTSYTPDSSLR